MPMLKVPNADMTPYDRLKMFIQQRGGPPAKDTFTTGPGQSLDNRLQEERGKIPNLPKAPYKGHGVGPEASLWDDGLPRDPSLMEQAKQFLAAVVMDPNNVGMPGVGISYRGVKTAVDKMLEQASRGGYKNVEQALLESNPANLLHPDALHYMNNIRLSGAIDSAGQLHHLSPIRTTVPNSDPFWVSDLTSRGGRQGGAYDLLYNPDSLESRHNILINPVYTRGVVEHEIAHANHQYGKEVPMPAYNSVVERSPVAEKSVREYGTNIMRKSGHDPMDLTEVNARDYINYFLNNPNELVAQFHAVSKVAPETIVNAAQADPYALKLLDPVYYQSLLDFMKR